MLVQRDIKRHFQSYNSHVVLILEYMGVALWENSFSTDGHLNHMDFAAPGYLIYKGLSSHYVVPNCGKQKEYISAFLDCSTRRILQLRKNTEEY